MAGKCWDPAYHKAHYETNKATYIARARAHDAAHHERCKHFLRGYFEFFGCTRCPVTDWRVLECHHRDRATKVSAVADMMSRKMSLLRIVAELEKCDMLCANCHRIESRVTLWTV